MLEHLEELRAMIEGADAWPPPWEREVREEVRHYAALRESEKDRLTPTGWDPDRDLVVDPMPARIADAKADLAFGEDPSFTAADSADQDNLDGLVAANELPSALQEAERVRCSEAEVWPRVVIDPDVSHRAIVEFVSRLDLIPLWRGRRLLAVAFVSEIERGEHHRFTLIEYRCTGYSLNVLYKSEAEFDEKNNCTRERDASIGVEVPLESHPATVDLRDEWNHGLDSLLAWRIPYKLGRDKTRGISCYRGAVDLFHALNEATTIGTENARLTLKRRMLVHPSMVDENGTVPGLDDDVLVSKGPLSSLLGENEPSTPATVLEYSFDAEALNTYDGNLADKCCRATRTAPQLIGRHTEDAATGPALRARLLDSILDSNGTCRFWDDFMPAVLADAALAESLGEAEGGLGIAWSAAEELPTFERASALPADESEETNRITTLNGGGLMSRRTSLRELHPEWDDAAIDEELAEIDRDLDPEPFEPEDEDEDAETPAPVPPEFEAEDEFEPMPDPDPEV